MQQDSRVVADVTAAEESERQLDRVAAVDVAKASGMVCTRLPHPSVPGRRVSRVWSVPATTGAVTELADQLADLGVERVVLEATSDYWRVFFYLFEARGLDVWLVNARDAKQVPGRPKTDKLDAVWLAKLNERGMLRPSFVPPTEIRELRDLTRLRRDLTVDRTRVKQRAEKILEDALIKISAVVSDLFGASGRAMMEALVAGERDPRVLAGLARTRLRGRQPALAEALTGRFGDHHAFLLRMLLDQVDALTSQIEALDARVEAALAAMPAAQAPPPAPGGGDGDPQAPAPLPAVARLCEVPGIGRHAAQTIIAEVGLDMARFPTPGHLVSWAKLCPRTLQSGAAHRAGKTGRGNPYLKGALGEAAAAAARSNTFLGARHRRLARRRGKLKALVATARSILVIVWQLLADPAARFRDLGPDHYTRQLSAERRTRNLVHQLEVLGHTVTLAPAAAA